MFIYEVKGLKQSDQTDQAASRIRKSSTALFPIPYSRMNAFMQRIGCMGGEIVAIHDSWDAATKTSATEESDPT
ncbi:MAG: phycobilisome linker polypeptide [Elainellaceae cyanobacterium]